MWYAGLSEEQDEPRQNHQDTTDTSSLTVTDASPMNILTKNDQNARRETSPMNIPKINDQNAL